MSISPYNLTKNLLRNSNFFGRIISIRCASTNKFTGTTNHSSQEGSSENHGKMKAWQIHEYGGVEILQCSDNIKIPSIKSPNEVCIEIKAASVNPIDVAMMGKYF